MRIQEYKLILKLIEENRRLAIAETLHTLYKYDNCGSDYLRDIEYHKARILVLQEELYNIL